MRRSFVRRTSVAISGGGPSGLTAAILLGRWGVPCTLIEPLEAPSSHPRAHVLSARTMEIARDLGVEPAIVAEAPPMETWSRFRYCTAVDGSDFGVAEHGSSAAAADLERASPCSVAHVSQPRFEAVLRARLAELPVRTLYGRRVVSVTPDGALLDDGETVEATRVVGADGPRGAVRSALRPERDVALERALGVSSLSPLQHFVSVHFESRELAERLRGREAMLYFVFNERTVSVVVAHDLERGVFNLQAPFFPPDDPPTDFLACFHKAPSDLVVHPPKTWAMRARVDAHFSSDNLYLVGDAAHEMPPSGGFGLNCAVQDAHNLAWKLARSASGDDAWLESYESERRPAAAKAVAVAVDNYKRGLLVPDALGAPPRALDAGRAAVGLAAVLGPTAHQAARSALRASTGFAYRAAFGGVPCTSRLTKLLDARAELPLYFPHVDLGVCYDGRSTTDAAFDALVHARHASGAQPFVPSFEAGRRLPHFPTRTASSSLDCVFDSVRHRPDFVVLVFALGCRSIFANAAPPDVRVVEALPTDTSAFNSIAQGDDASSPVVAALVRPDAIILRVWTAADVDESGVRASMHAALRRRL